MKVHYCTKWLLFPKGTPVMIYSYITIELDGIAKSNLYNCWTIADNTQEPVQYRIGNSWGKEIKPTNILYYV